MKVKLPESVLADLLALRGQRWTLRMLADRLRDVHERQMSVATLHRILLDAGALPTWRQDRPKKVTLYRAPDVGRSHLVMRLRSYGASLGDIALDLGVSKQAVAKIVAHMNAKGYVVPYAKSARPQANIPPQPMAATAGNQQRMDRPPDGRLAVDHPRVENAPKAPRPARKT